jgi:hypothetical protein
MRTGSLQLAGGIRAIRGSALVSFYLVRIPKRRSIQASKRVGEQTTTPEVAIQDDVRFGME